MAKQGHPQAQYELALMYLNGEGIRQKFKKAYQWFEKAAKQGHASAQYELALIYEEGRKGFFFKLDKNLTKTYYWLMEASKQGHDSALIKLTEMICGGEGTQEDINKALAWLKEASKQGIARAQSCLDQIHEKGPAIGAAGLLAVAGMEQGYAQSHESTEEVVFQIKTESSVQTEEYIHGLNRDSQTVSEAGGKSDPQTVFAMDEESVSQAVSEAGAEASQTEETASEISEEMIIEVSDLLGEVAADLALDWIPGIGFGKLGFEAVTGVHLLTGRNLSPFERVASGGGAVLNLVGLGWLKNLKSLKHSKTMGQEVYKWVSININGEQWAKFVRFVKEGQIEKSKGYLRAFFQSVGEIGFKVQRRTRSTVRSTRKVFVRGGSSVDEASETVVVNMEEGLGVPGKLESGKLSRAVDPDKMSNPGQSKVYKTGDLDQVPSVRDGVFVRTPKGDQPLDYNNPEIGRWLKQTEAPQRQTLEDLIERSTSRTTGRFSSSQSLIKNGTRGSAKIDDFDLVLH